MALKTTPMHSSEAVVSPSTVRQFICIPSLIFDCCARKQTRWRVTRVTILGLREIPADGIGAAAER